MRNCLSDRAMTPFPRLEHLRDVRALEPAGSRDLRNALRTTRNAFATHRRRPRYCRNPLCRNRLQIHATHATHATHPMGRSMKERSSPVEPAARLFFFETNPRRADERTVQLAFTIGNVTRVVDESTGLSR
jgi:hypothetical protein